MRPRCPSAAGFCLENNLVRAAPGARIYSGWPANPKPSAKGNQGITPKVDSGFKSVRPALKEVTQALGSSGLRLKCTTLSRAQVWETQEPTQKGMPSKSKHLEPSLSHSQTEGSSVKPHSRPAAESYHQKRGSWECDSREGDTRTCLPRLRQWISWELN